MKSKNNIPAIIGKLLPWERKFIVDTIQISDNIITFLHETKMQPDEFCERFKIEKTEYNKFINGEWNYSLDQISTLEYLWTEHKRGKLKVNIIDVIFEEESKKQI